ncbi:hypothetical protein OSW16_15420 [Pseudomonas putida]|uniref:hypothetical protein n=1 Tax=Pseudomonas putida TaxID=303 RepID=UPI00226DE5D9|nr:hypothetical protein [Pseudomonas putida]WAB95957.1 hypothetical protein OSW16_15420 [Pseudomonas putida]
MLTKLLEIIDQRAVDAQFELVSIEALMLNDDQKWPEGKAPGQLGYWESEFASLLLVDFTDKKSTDVKRYADRAVNYLDARILQREKTKPVIDGYLVMAVQASEEMKDFILAVEKNTLFVRKHVVVMANGEWERCERITPIGLSRSSSLSTPPAFTPNDAGAVGLLEALATIKSTELAKLHGKEWNLNE